MAAQNAEIEKVLYTASLASDYTAIDELVDPVRGITSRLSDSAPLTDQDRKTIASVQGQLETYLVTKEKLRIFTPEALKVQIEQHLQGERLFNRSRWLLALVLFLTAAAAFGVTRLPAAPDTPFLLVRLIGFTVVAALHVGAAWLFLSALASFKSELRKAFVVLCLGITLLGLALLEQPLIELLSSRDVPFVGVLISASLAVAAFVFYLGVYLYARSVGVQSLRWPIFVVAAVLAVISFIVPHAPSNDPEIAYDIAATLQGWVAIFPMMSFFIMVPVVRKLSEVYKPPARALQHALFVIVLVTILVYIIRLTVGANFSGVPAVIALTLLILEGSFLVRAGYAFNKISRY
ncbi:MAG TPA: hypothetical protein VFT87_04970 [Candidatus Saccharimonadales bacterium]|nr:hypothetical protein [Candidatus Saccharimonadales bacterium]